MTCVLGQIFVPTLVSFKVISSINIHRAYIKRFESVTAFLVVIKILSAFFQLIRMSNQSIQIFLFGVVKCFVLESFYIKIVNPK